MTTTGKTATIILIWIAASFMLGPLFGMSLKAVAADQTYIIEETETEWIYLGKFRTTGYCKCSVCCGKWSEVEQPDKQPGDCVGVDYDEIPKGTKLYINDIGYRTALDTGSAAKGKMIDIMYGTHEQAKEHAVQWLEVWMIKEDSEQ